MTSERSLYTKGTRVWLKDLERVWKPGVIIRPLTDTSLAVEAEDGGEVVELIIKDDSQLPPLRNPDILIGENDLTNLSYLHEPAVLFNLSVRFLQNEAIYTYCGIVLVAINPYCDLHIYGNDTIAMYRGKSMGDLDPHVYAVAEEAFTKMERDARDQSIIVSGESGAGKTVSAKYAMRYFATVGGTSQTESNIERKVLASSPIMEAIGNAKTTRNDNSSRFGKYIEIDFNKQFHIIGANMRTYLLEKSRVVFQASEERNYHIFYQLCTARDSKDYGSFKLKSPDEFFYLNQGAAPEIYGVDDSKEFQSTIDAFNLLGFSEKEQWNIFTILAGILHLGNVPFERGGSGRSDSESCVIPSDDLSLSIFAELLEIEEEQIKKWLCHRKIVTARETFTKPMDAGSALFARDALAKCIYSRLFDWIVVQINRALMRKSGKMHKFIGVLDIYGFETFETNSFEQFCINYANEKLQQQFNMHVFKLEQDEYLKEGIEWTMIDFYDNQPCIDLIESKLGILDLLDEECRMPKGSDQSWVEKLYGKCGKWEHFSKPRLSNTAFLVRHFADKVEYESHGFLDKNRDTVLEEQLNILKASKNDLLSDLFLEYSSAGDHDDSPGKFMTVPKSSSNTPSRAAASKTLSTPSKKQNKKTVGSQFRDSLNMLMSTLNSTTPHYIRCIKPNDAKTAFELDPKRAIQQLRACGVLETVRISAAGFPSRWTYHDFFVRYRVLCHSKDVKRGNYRATCEKIVSKMASDEDKVKLGKTKIFFRAGQVAYMERLRSQRLRDCGVMIQKHVKGWLYHKKYLQIKKSVALIQKQARGVLARKRFRHMQMTRAAIVIQKNVRGFLRRRQYARIRYLTLSLQARCRGFMARERHLALVRDAKAVVIQAHVRGWLARKRFQKSMAEVIIVQCQIRRFLARKKLKKLKIEARSVEHQKKLNQGLENKIISLQQRLTESERANKQLRRMDTERQTAVKELENLRQENDKNRSLRETVVRLEAELKGLKIELDQERSDKVDIVNDKEREAKEWASREEDLSEQLEGLKFQVSDLNGKLNEKNENDFREATAKVEEEKLRLVAECDQERMAYQKLLKSYNSLEAQLENARDELSLFRSNGVLGGMAVNNNDTTPSSSMIFTDGEEFPAASSGYESGRSSLRSSGTQIRGTIGDNIMEWKGQEQDVSLMIKMQQKLKEAQAAKEKLERRVEHLESSLAAEATADKKQPADLVRLQEYEMENNRLKANLKRLRESIAEETESALVKEMTDQFDGLQDEAERRREECIQLRTILANLSLENSQMSEISSLTGGELADVEELSRAYQNQKMMIDQLQERLNGQEEIENELKEELDNYKQTCASQQNLIQQAINKPASNNTETCLQYEITRLTSENFNLREQIEVLNENKKQLKKMLKTYMSKLTEVGAPIPDAGASDDLSAQEDKLLVPKVLRKDYEYLGMLEYRKDEEDKILKSLIFDLKPKMALRMLPGLPAYLLFMMIRYTDYINNDDHAKSLIQRAIFYVKKAIKRKGTNDVEVKTLWLSNMLRFLHNLKQYSGESRYQALSSPKQVDQCLRNFDLSEFARILMDVAVWIYQGITKLVEEEIQPILVHATLEHEGISGISSGQAPHSHLDSSSHRGGPGSMDDSATHSIDPHEALDKLLRLLTRFHSIFIKHGLDPEVISQIFKQVFFFICAGSLNNLLLRKELCHWSRGMQIRYNIAQLEQWARDQKIHDEKSQVINALAPIVQASQLLQARKSDEDVQAICDMCDALKVTQIIKILNLYTPADEFEERVSPSFVRKIQQLLQEKSAKEATGQGTLLMDTKFLFLVKFPFYPSSIQLEELEIPDFFNGLHTMLKRV